jgi:NAD(P)-dependent dehydrogenase (short-subunit alcohol dehydrogenase family)
MMKQFSLDNKIAVVTGSGQGIGRSIAITFAKAGADLVVVDINMETAEVTAGNIQSLGRNVIAIQVDVRDKNEVDVMITKTIEKFGCIDILVNNAGFGYMTVPIFEMLEEDWDECITLNLKSTFLCCKAVSKIMIKQKKGTIINMASMAALGGYPMGANYSAAKAAIKNLTETLAVELGPHNIRVNALAPGVIETQLTAELYRKRPELKEQRLKHIPLRRLGTPEDVANVALFLASDASSYISGETIPIKGGMATFVTPELIEELSKKIY